MDMAKMNWERWLSTEIGKQFNNMSEYEKRKHYNQQFLKYIYTNTIYIVFDEPQPHFPDRFDFGIYHWQTTLVTQVLNEIKLRIDEFTPCYHCGGAECARGRCPQHKLKVDVYIRIFNLLEQFNGNRLLAQREAKRRIGKCCKNCGESGGHWGVNRCPKPMGCKFCGSKTHDSGKSWKCPYWVRYAILTLLFDDYYKKNLKRKGEFISLPSNLNENWEMNDWVFSPSLEEISDSETFEHVKKIWRMTDIIKYNIKNNDIFGRNMDITDLEYIFELENESENGDVNENGNGESISSNMKDNQEIIPNKLYYQNYNYSNNIELIDYKKLLKDALDDSKSEDYENEEDETDETDDDMVKERWSKVKKKGKRLSNHQQRNLLRNYNRLENTVTTTSKLKKRTHRGGRKVNKNKNKNKGSRSIDIAKLKDRLLNIDNQNKKINSRRKKKQKKLAKDKMEKRKQLNAEIDRTKRMLNENREKQRIGEFRNNYTPQSQQQQKNRHAPQSPKQQQKQQQQQKKQQQQQQQQLPRLPTIENNHQNVENVEDLDSMLNNLQSIHYNQINEANGNQGNNSMYLNKNPSMGNTIGRRKIYRPKRDHNQRTLDLGHPNSFVGGHQANMVSAAGDIVHGHYGPTKSYLNGNQRFSNHNHNHNYNENINNDDVYNTQDARFDPIGNKHHINSNNNYFDRENRNFSNMNVNDNYYNNNKYNNYNNNHNQRSKQNGNGFGAIGLL